MSRDTLQLQVHLIIFFFYYVSSRSLTLVPRAQCAFVQYTTRSAAEHVAEKTFNRLVIGGKRLTIKWGKSQGKLLSSTLISIGLCNKYLDVKFQLFF